MIRFLHTADWQLGLKLAFIGGDRGAYARAERFEVVRRIAGVARERQVQAVVVAGDVFDDNGVGRDTIQRARDALAEFAPVPVLLLPGNHDAGGPDSVLRRLDAGRHVHALLDRAPWGGVPGVRFYPCPLLRRHEKDDPSAHLPPREPTDPIRVAVAHGGLLEFGEGESPNRIDAPSVLAKGFDYLALGDWHGLLSFGPRVFYPGAPEATRFKEKKPGHVLLVEIDEPGAVPRVLEIEVQRTRWIEHREVILDDTHVDAVGAWLDALPTRSMALVDLTLVGNVSLEGRARLDALLERASAELMHLRVHEDELQDRPSPSDLARLEGDGLIGRAAQRLRASEAPEAADALRLLHRLSEEKRS